jgi:signal peptidase II
MAERSYRGLFWGLVCAGTALDQVSKYGVFRWLYHDDGVDGEYVVIPGAFRLLAQFTKETKSTDDALASLRTWSGDFLPRVNHGALFGFGGEYRTLANAIFAIVSIVAALAIIYWSTRPSTVRDRSLCAALGLILAGTLGNLYDRVVFNGVRDFLHFHLINWPVFNIADCCLVCGAFVLLSQAFWSGQAATGGQPATEAAVSPEMAKVQ